MIKWWAGGFGIPGRDLTPEQAQLLINRRAVRARGGLADATYFVRRKKVFETICN
jgi:hypothetical protein